MRTSTRNGEFLLVLVDEYKGRQGGRQAGRQAGREAGRQAGVKQLHLVITSASVSQEVGVSGRKETEGKSEEVAKKTATK